MRMFQKPAFLDWNEDTHDRYLTMGGFPVYVYEEPSFLKRAFRRARDYIASPEIHYPLLFNVAAMTMDNMGVQNYFQELYTKGAVFITAGILMKTMESLADFGSDLSPISRRDLSYRKPLYFDKNPEGELNSEKPQPDFSMTLKSRSKMNITFST